MNHIPVCYGFGTRISSGTKDISSDFLEDKNFQIYIHHDKTYSYSDQVSGPEIANMQKKISLSVWEKYVDIQKCIEL